MYGLEGIVSLNHKAGERTTQKSAALWAAREQDNIAREADSLIRAIYAAWPKRDEASEGYQAQRQAILADVACIKRIREAAQAKAEAFAAQARV